MKVLFLVPRLDKASTRYRVLQYLPFLEQAGIVCAVRPLSGKTVGWISLGAEISRADVVFVQKKLLNGPVWHFISALSRRLIFDFDDAIMLKESETDFSSRCRQFRRFAGTVRRVDLVVCGNRYLAENTAALNGNLQILPTVIDEQRYRPRQCKPVRNEKGNLVIGWMGSRTNLPYLQEIVPQLQAACQAVPGTRFKIVSDAFLDFKDVEVIKKPWRSEEEISDLESFDIGIMPLPDTPWCRGKCGFKLIQYMAVGTPVVCSPVGVNAEIVTDGREGFWARRPEEWVERLVRLLKDRDLRQTMGNLGRETIVRRFSLQANADRLIELLRNLAAEPEERVSQ
ncbi:MAG: glycosyltransferase family 4 protein [Syntrophotaleaceae bacterium]